MTSGREWMTTAEIAAAVNARGKYHKRDDSPVSAYQIHGRFYSPHQLASVLDVGTTAKERVG